MNANASAIRVVARLTPVGSGFPFGAWYYNTYYKRWFVAVLRTKPWVRTKHRISEFEANTMGIYAFCPYPKQAFTRMDELRDYYGT